MGMERMAGFGLLFAASMVAGVAGFTNDGKQNCSYTVKIETTCTKGAETSDHVSLRFGDVDSHDVTVRHLNSKHVRRVDKIGTTVLDDVPRRPFQACSIDEFQVEGPCVESTVCYLYLKHIGKDNWRPGRVQVHVAGKPGFSSLPFYFRRFVPEHVWHGDDMCDTQVTPFGIRHTRKVLSKKPKTRSP
ncbi:hypothetical protein AMTRI_Chr08g207350 [Amborella trichopoda]